MFGIIVLVWALLSTIAVILLAGMYYDHNKKYKEYAKTHDEAERIQSYKDVTILEADAKAKDTIERARVEALNIIADAESKSENDLRIAHEALQKMESMKSEIHKLTQLHAILQENVDLDNLNFYEPHFDFEKSVDFERKIGENRKNQRNLITSGGAILIDETYDLNKKLVSLLKKLLIRTFNSESDFITSMVDYKNIVTYENRLGNTFEQLNKMTSPWGVTLNEEFYQLKMNELRLVFELQEKKHEEEEEQRHIKEIMRDEIRAEREMEKALAETQKQQKQYQDMLDRAILEAQKTSGEELERMNAKIALLQNQLDETKAKERAISQAQLTKAGYVYVISNIGSFGEDVYKIGMTRRLDPQERVDELGDASVPFPFDVHAMIYCENAPELENILHKEFESNRVNRINQRKEFFKVDLESIERIAHQMNGEFTFTHFAEAKEYRQSIAMLENSQKTA